MAKKEQKVKDIEAMLRLQQKLLQQLKNEEYTYFSTGCKANETANMQIRQVRELRKECEPHKKQIDKLKSDILKLQNEISKARGRL